MLIVCLCEVVALSTGVAIPLVNPLVNPLSPSLTSTPSYSLILAYILLVFLISVFNFSSTDIA